MRKDIFISVIGFLGACIAQLFGGWNTALATLLICMTVDYITGFAVAAVFKKSTKTQSGALASIVGFKGLCKKGMMLLIVLIAYRFDLTFNTAYIRDTVIIAFIANEAVSIAENAGLMGVPLPKVLTKAIDLLKNREEEGTEQ